MIGIVALTTASGFIVLAVLLGYLGEKFLGAFLMGVAALIASTVCLGGAVLGYTMAGEVGAWVGLVLGMVLAGLVIPWGLSKVIKGTSRKFITIVWAAFCLLNIYGYLAADWIGLLTITWPAIAVFWLGLYFISGYILPLRDPSQRGLAYRSLLTFTLGTNYPYYLVNDNSKPDKRIDGNPFRQFFAGPGFVYTPPDHAAYITNGVSTNRVAEPGLTFTHRFDIAPEIVDLRTQLRAFDVEARTKDGIPIKVHVFIPFRINTGNQGVVLGEAFPFRPEAVHKALAQELTERKASRHETGEKYEWDGKLAEVITTPIMQDIISRYTVDELCEPENSARDPRVEIVEDMQRRVKAALRSYGLEVIGGGIGNLMPQDNKVTQRRIRNWQTKWQGKIQSRMSEGQASRALLIEGAKAEAERMSTQYLTEIVKRDSNNGHKGHNTVVLLQFLEALKGFNTAKNRSVE